MSRVTGIGGFFFRAADPEALSAWYREVLGIATDAHGQWTQEAGSTVFAPFPEASNYFAADRRWMLNLRVEGLDGLLDRLRLAGVEVVTDPKWEDTGFGRFAHIHDPEGNPIELWEASPPAASETA